MPTCYLTRLINLGDEPIEIEIEVGYRYTSHSTPDNYWEPGDPCEIEIEYAFAFDGDRVIIPWLALLPAEFDRVDEHAAENEGEAFYDPPDYD